MAKAKNEDFSSQLGEQTGIRTPGLPEGYDPRVQAQQLLRTIRAGTLATLGRDGYPFASLVNVATGMDGSPLLLLSGLSAHTQNLDADPRASILLAAAGKGDPLANPRLTVTGQAAKIEDEPALETAKARFLSRHPKSALYADFGDFAFWRLAVAHGHLNGGFARAAQFEPHALLTSMDSAEELEAIESEALQHMNHDHASAVKHYAVNLLGLRNGRWKAVAIDPEGIDMMLGSESARLAFPERVHNGRELRAMLANLAKTAQTAP